MLASLRHWSASRSCRQCSSDWFRRCRPRALRPRKLCAKGTPSAGASRRQKHFRDALVVGEIALSLAPADLRRIAAAQPAGAAQFAAGIRPPQCGNHGDLPAADRRRHGGQHGGKYAGKDISQVFYPPLLDRLSHLPGVDSAAITTHSAVDRRTSRRAAPLRSSGAPKIRPTRPVADVRAGQPEPVFARWAFACCRGRLFTDDDAPASAAVAVVNQALVQQIFPRPESAWGSS